MEKTEKKTNVVLKTDQGDIKIALFPEIAPKACENFVGLIKKEYYNGIIFHRVIKDFMIQGGDPTATGTGGESIWNRPFEDEVTSDITFNKEGILAMANSGKNTNGSQFFITTKPTPWLNNKHTIFGEVIEGYDVVEKIENTETDARDKPKKDQTIIKAYVVNNNK
ncbi:MAG: peptidylprolyl isomerase [Candidatus Omnitrophota bacterium]